MFTQIHNITKKTRNLFATRRNRLIGVGVLIFFLLGAVIASFSLKEDSLASWWEGGGDYQKRQRLTVTNDSGDNLASETTIAITVNTKALYESGKLQDDCDDIRIVHQPNNSTHTELDRYISYPGGQACSTSEATKVYFQLQAALNDTTSSDDYYMYYNNGSASSPSSTVDAFDTADDNALLVCPFDGTTECINGDGTEDPTTETGAIRYSGAKSALSFDGITSDNRINTGQPSDFEGLISSNNVTIEWWQYFTGNNNNSTGHVVSYDISGSSDHPWRAGSHNGNYISYSVDTDSTDANYRTPDDSIVRNQWQHVAIVWDYQNKSAKIYINGVEPAYHTETPGDGNYISDTGAYLNIGRTNYSCGACLYGGLLDEIRVSNIKRYTSNFTPSTAPFVRDEYTTLLYHLDENGDDPRDSGKVFDDSGNEIHGTISGPKYVSGLVGTDGILTFNGVEGSQEGKTDSHHFAGHEGIFIEEGTTNKITNPSFEHATYNTSWTASASATIAENTTTNNVKFGSKSARYDAYTTDSYGVENSTSYQYIYSTTDNKRLSQGFQVSEEINASTVTLYLWEHGSPTGYAQIEIQTDSSGVPSGTPIANGVSSTCLPQSSISHGMYDFSFSTPPTLSTSTQYHIVMKVYTDECSTEQSAANSSNTHKWHYDGSGTYSYGDKATMNESNVWTTQTGQDHIFYISDYDYSTFYTSVNPGNTNDHTFSAFVYNPTYDTVNNSVAQVVWEGELRSDTNYTNVGNGWWRISYTAATSNSTNDYGIYVINGNTVYIDGVQLEETTIATTYADGSLASDSGGNDTYFWDDDCDGTLDAGEDETADQNTQCSSRIAEDIQFSATNIIDPDNGTISFWTKTNWNSSQVDTSAERKIFLDTNLASSDYMVLYRHESAGWWFHPFEGDSEAAVGNTASVTRGQWYHVAATWDSSDVSLCINTSCTTEGYTDSAFTPSTIYFGQNRNNSNQGDSTISDLRIFDAALTSTEIADLYYSGLVSHQTAYEVDGFSSDKGQDPVAIWHFDESYGSTANDSSQYGNHLTIDGASWNTDSGNSRSNLMRNLEFDGTDDSASRSGELSEFNFGTGSYSISGWFRHVSSISGTDTILSRYADAGYKVYMNSSGYICSALDDDSTWTPDDEICSGSDQGSYADSKWHHFETVARRNEGDDIFSLFIDGTPVATASAVTATGSLNGSADIVIGADDSDGTPDYWDGFLDEIIIYPYARTEAQIKTDVLGSQTSTLFGSQEDDWISDGLVGYWKMDETSWDGTSDEVIDYSGNGNHGAAGYNFSYNTGTATSATASTLTDTNKDWLTNYFAGTLITITSGTGDGQIRTVASNTDDTITVSSDWSPTPDGTSQYLIYYYPSPDTGKFGNGGSFSGFSGGGADYIGTHADFGKPTSLNLTGAMTLSAWINGSSFSSGSNYVVSRHSCCGAAGWYIDVNSSGNPVFQVASDGTTTVSLTSDTTLSTSTWYHFTGVYIPGKSLQIFINGVLDKSLTAGIPSSQYSPSGADVHIGGGELQNTYFSGLIDEARIHNRALSPIEVEKLYKWAPGPIAHWKLDENTGSSAYDTSGNGNNSSTWTGDTSWTSGKFGSGLSFDGDDDVIRFAESSTTDIGSATASYTVSAWMNTSKNWSGENGGIVAKRSNSGGFPFSLTVVAGNDPAFMIGDGTFTPSAKYSTEINDGQWHHITGVRSVDDDYLYLYVDGILQDSTQDTTTAALSNDHDVSIGNYGNSYDGVDFDGKIDDVRIYNYVRTQEQIIEDMNAGHPAPGSPVGSALFHYKFDEGYGDTAYDSGSVSANGDLSGSCPGASTCPTWIKSGKIAGALNFERDNSQMLSASTGITTDYVTVSAWIKPQSWESSGYNGIASTDEWSLRNVNNSFQFAVYTSAWNNGHTGINSNTYLPIDQWSHILATYDGTTMKVYVNGSEVDSDTATTPGVLGDAWGTMKIGEGLSTGRYFDGVIDDVKVYNTILTPSQIKTEYNQGKAVVFGATSTDSSHVATWSATNEYCPPGQGSACTPPVAEWKFDEKTSTSAYDTSENNNTGTLTNGPIWRHGGACHSGSCLEFDGAGDDNDYVDAGTNSSLDYLASGDFTASAWIYLKSQSEQYILDKAGNSTTTGWRFRLDGSHGLTGTVEYNTTDANYRAGWDEVTTNTWHYVTMVFDNSSGVIDLYVDGSEVDYVIGQETPGSDTPGDEDKNLYIGNRESESTALDGLIDQVRIYNYARTPAQIAWEYNRGKPVGWWKLDECSGTVAYDASGNGNNGTIEPGDTSGSNDSVGTCSSGAGDEMWDNGTNGKFNASLDFDGTNDYVNLGAPDELDFGNQDYSITLWTKLNAEADYYYPIFKGDQHNGTDMNYGIYYHMLNQNYWMWISSNGSSEGTHLQCQETGGVVVGNWYFITAWHDSENNLKGCSINAGAQYTSSQSGSHDGSSNITLGNESPTWTNWFDGQIDDVKIYNYVLTQQQINDIYNYGAVRFGN